MRSTNGFLPMEIPAVLSIDAETRVRRSEPDGASLAEMTFGN